jgi:hypothetical protein
MQDKLDFYSKEQLLDLKQKQEQNRFICEHKDEFFSICNKILDFLYTEQEVDLKRDHPMYPDLAVITNSAKDFELIRKKIKNGGQLAEGEIAALLVATQYVCTDMSRLAKLYEKASKELEDFIKTLTFQDK